MNKYEALHTFWSSFGLPAYNEQTVPYDAPLPRITYEAGSGALDEVLLLRASIWYRSTSWTDIHAKSEQIAEYIETEMPPSISFSGGFLKIRRGEPFSQDGADEDDDTIRRVDLNIEVEFLSRF